MQSLLFSQLPLSHMANYLTTTSAKITAFLPTGLLSASREMTQRINWLLILTTELESSFKAAFCGHWSWSEQGSSLGTGQQ